MKIESKAFKNNSNIPKKYTCDGENINPPLEISEVPEGVASLVLIMEDPDAPTGTFIHWIVYNIDPNTREIKEDGVPLGAILGMTSSGEMNYVGPCPPSGVHRYFFKIYALDALLSLYKPSAEELNIAMDVHIIDEAELIGLYQREG